MDSESSDCIIYLNILIMKKLIKITLIFCVSLFLTSCSGLSSHLTKNLNLQQTNVVLSEANYHIVKHVDTEVTATYIFGFGGYKSTYQCDCETHTQTNSFLFRNYSSRRGNSYRIR